MDPMKEKEKEEARPEGEPRDHHSPAHRQAAPPPALEIFRGREGVSGDPGSAKPEGAGPKCPLLPEPGSSRPCSSSKPCFFVCEMVPQTGGRPLQAGVKIH